MQKVCKKIADHQEHYPSTIFSSVFELPTLKQMRDQLICEAISRTKSISEAARILGISRQSLSHRITNKKINEYRLQ